MMIFIFYDRERRRRMEEMRKSKTKMNWDTLRKLVREETVDELNTSRELELSDMNRTAATSVEYFSNPMHSTVERTGDEKGGGGRTVETNGDEKSGGSGGTSRTSGTTEVAKTLGRFASTGNVLSLKKLEAGAEDGDEEAARSTEEIQGHKFFADTPKKRPGSKSTEKKLKPEPQGQKVLTNKRVLAQRPKKY